MYLHKEDTTGFLLKSEREKAPFSLHPTTSLFAPTEVKQT